MPALRKAIPMQIPETPAPRMTTRYGSLISCPPRGFVRACSVECKMVFVQQSIILRNKQERSTQQRARGFPSFHACITTCFTYTRLSVPDCSRPGYACHRITRTRRRKISASIITVPISSIFGAYITAYITGDQVLGLAGILMHTFFLIWR
jgi:hypothetical protein